MGKGKKVSRLLAKLQGTDLLPCPPCNAGEHWACHNPTDEITCCCPPVEFENVTNDRKGATKEAQDITDVQSTGRKRAAQLFPIHEGMVCEWSRLAKAGGGVTPIVGCIDNTATDRHHGPDKNTLNNKEGNVHRICSPCHNLWHARNDQYYGERPAGTEPFIPLDGHEWCLHDSTTQADMTELVQANLGRKQPKDKR